MKILFSFLTLLVFVNVAGYSQNKKENPSDKFKQLQLHKASIPNSILEKLQMSNHKENKLAKYSPTKFASISLLDSTYQWEHNSYYTGLDLTSKTYYTYDLNNNLSNLIDYWFVYDTVYISLYIYTYDLNNLIEIIDQEWNGKGWANYSQYIYTYDSKNNLKSFLSQSWVGNAWGETNKDFFYLYAYDTYNNQISETDQYWNGNNWDNYNKLLYTYDSNNNQISETYQKWNGNGWDNSDQFIDTYDSNNYKISDRSQMWNGNSWDNVKQCFYTYDSNGNQISKTYQTWNGSSWDNYDQDFYTYNSNNTLNSDVYYLWYKNGNSWYCKYQDVYTYDSNNNQTSNLGQVGDCNIWFNDYQNFYTYDSNNNQISEVGNSTWNGSGWDVIVDSTHNYYHESSANVKGIKNTEINISIYPNPVQDVLNINLHDQTNSIKNINLYNLVGEKIYSLGNLNTKNEILNMNGFDAGIYFIEVKTEKETFTEKVCLNK